MLPQITGRYFKMPGLFESVHRGRHQNPGIERAEENKR